LSQCQAEFELNQAIGKKLNDLNLLEVKQVQATSANAETMNVDGFYAVEPTRLASLSSEAIVDLVRSGTYEPICLHLASLRNFELLRDRSLEVEPASAQ
jgi:hypothetical protein